MQLLKMNLEFEEAKQMCLDNLNLTMRRMDGKHIKTSHFEGRYIPETHSRHLYRVYKSRTKGAVLARLNGGQNHPWEVYEKTVSPRT